MKLKSMKCSNCGGNVKQIGNCLMCESCGSSFAIDYDAEDVEYKRIELEREKLQYQQNAQQNMQQNMQQGMPNMQGMTNNPRNMQQFGRPVNQQMNNARSSRTIKVILITFVVIFILSFIAPFIMFFGAVHFFDKVANEMEGTSSSGTQTKQVVYVKNTNRILEDEGFVKEINDAFYSEIKNDLPKSWTASEWEQEDVEYVTSYLLWEIENEPRFHNRLLSVYKTTWKVTYLGEEHTVELYNALATDNVKWDEATQKIRSDYSVNRRTGTWVEYGAVRNGTTDFDGIRREQVLGMEGYYYEEFDMNGNMSKEAA